MTKIYNHNTDTVEPLTNDHPHQRPSLSYDHISCDGQWFLFVYESLTSDHPSYTTTPMWFWGWSYKRGSTVYTLNFNNVVHDTMGNFFFRIWRFFWTIGPILNLSQHCRNTFEVFVSDVLIWLIIHTKVIIHSFIVASTAVGCKCPMKVSFSCSLYLVVSFRASPVS